MNLRLLPLLCCALTLVISGCGGRKDVTRSGAIKLRGEKPVSLNNRKPGDFLQKGTASWYGHPFHGRKTSNGETYNMWNMTAAHKTLPFGTWIRVVNMDNGREALVRINDRGPFIRGRIIDLSRKAAEAIDMVGSGTAHVRLFLAKDHPSQFEPPSRPVRERPSQESGSIIWTVQVASFQDASKAVELADELSDQYESIRIEKAEGYFRVRIGQFTARRQAERLASRLRKQGIEPWVTKDL